MDGFTLIEVMVALVFIAIGVMALSGLQTRSSSDVYRTGRQSRALTVAQERLEVARAGGYDALAPDTGSVDQFDYITSIADVNPTLRSVTVTVRWREGLDTTSVRLQTLVADR